MSKVLVVGAARGLGASLVKAYAGRGWTVYATTRDGEYPLHGPDLEATEVSQTDTIRWLLGVDLLNANASDSIVHQLKDFRETELDVVIITAGIFVKETWDGEGPNFNKEVEMYTVSSVAPVCIVQKLVTKKLLGPGSKVVLVSSEAGSIALRTSAEMNYGHHASKAALNMARRLLSFDLLDKEITVSIVHPGFMRTSMTKNVGLDQFYDKFHAVTPEEAAGSLRDWVDQLEISKTGQFWAPRGPADIGTAEEVMGTPLPTPLQLPW